MTDVALWKAEVTHGRTVLVPYNNLQQQDRQEEIL